MTDLQKKEYLMLKEAIEICDSLHLTYFLVCGSVIGAVKYGGFIPWDDDIDIALPRENYDIFIQNAQKFLSPHYFLQTSETDSNYMNLFSKIRDSETTYIEKSLSTTDINHGIYIDVFPLDGYPAKKSEQRTVERVKWMYQLACLTKLNVSLSWKAQLLVDVERAFVTNKNLKKYNKKCIKVISAYPTEESEIWCNHGNWQGKLEYAPREQYGNGTWAEFEGLKVRIPERFDDYLTKKYGDWRADLPDDQKFGHHFYERCDLNRPYTDYVEHLPHGKIRIKDPNK